MGAFQYHRLASPHSVRLILLRPSLWHDAPLVCSMKTFDISSSPRYEALSYTWDNQRPSQTIQCDGKKLLVTPNVESALRHLRRRLFRRRIWIDAVCIDQNNLQERGEQVSIMHLIYHRAASVIVWLGAGSRETDYGILELKWLFPFYKIALYLPLARYWSLEKFHARRVAFQHILAHGDQSTTIREKLKDYAYHPSLSGLQQILHHHWFRRIWTLQEISLARRARIMCGNSQVSWRTFCNALAFDHVFLEAQPPTTVLMDGGYNPVTPICDSVLFSHRIQYVQLLREWSRRIRYNRSWPTSYLPVQEQPHFSFIINLVLTGLNPGYECTNMQDRVFGLLGLLSTFGIQLPAPDYGKELPDLIVDTFTAILEQHQSLDLLLFTTGEQPLHGLPSWIPSYRAAPWPGNETRLSLLRSRSNPTSIPVFQLEGRKLTVHGVVIDLIEESTEPICATTDQTDRLFKDMPSHSQDIFLFRLLLHPQVINFYNNSNILDDEGLRFFVGTDESYSPHRLFEHFQQWLRKVEISDEALMIADHHIFDQVQHFISSERIFADQSARRIETIGYQRACMVIQRWIRENLSKKRLFRTTSGAVGIGWQALRLGDVVVLLDGLSFPLVLRRIGEDYNSNDFHVVSPCHIPGKQKLDFEMMRTDKIETINLL